MSLSLLYVPGGMKTEVGEVKDCVVPKNIHSSPAEGIFP